MIDSKQNKKYIKKEVIFLIYSTKKFNYNTKMLCKYDLMKEITKKVKISSYPSFNKILKELENENQIEIIEGFKFNKFCFGQLQRKIDNRKKLHSSQRIF